MSNLPHDPESDDIFGHLLDYQQTDEFQRDLEQSPRYQSQSSAEQAEAQARYRKRYPHAARMRAEAEKLKPQLAAQQAGLCYWCHEPLPPDYQTDHIIPIARGGTNALVNLCVCCRHCNATKWAKIVKWEQDSLF